MITLRTMIILFIVGYFLCPAEAQWSWVPSRMFTSYQFVCINYNNNNASMTSTNNSNPYTLALSDIHDNVQSSHIVLGGISNINDTDSAFTITFVGNFATQPTQAVFVLTLQGFTVVSQMQFHLLLVGTQAATYLDAITFSQTCNLTSPNQGANQQVYSATRTVNTTLTGSFNHDFFLSYFTMSQVQGGNNFAVGVRGMGTSSNQINFQYFVDRGNNLRNIAIVVVVYTTAASMPTNNTYYGFDTDRYSNVLPNAVAGATDPNSYDTGFDGKCMLGFLSLQYRFNDNIQYDISTPPPATTSTLSTPSLPFTIFCMIESYNCTQIDANCLTCISHTLCSSCTSQYYPQRYPNTTSRCLLCSGALTGCDTCTNTSVCLTCIVPEYLQSGSLCVLCSSYISNCLNCTDNVTCTGCVDYYGLVNSSTCALCSSITPGCQLCTNPSFCTQCFSGYYLSGSTCIECNLGVANCAVCPSGTQCQICFPDSYLSSDNSTCICNAGLIKVTGFCTVIGCSSAYRFNSTTLCLACNTSLNFYYSSNNCFCQTGYALSGYSCELVCGDGIVVTQACDDGNVVSGDGCSKTCTVEPNYNCVNGSLTSRSVCVYIGDLSLSLQEIKKVPGINQAEITLTISPNAPPLESMDFSRYLNLTVDGRTITYTTTYNQDGTLTVLVDYDKDLEGLSATLTLNYDPTLVDQTTQVVSFKMVGHNVPIIYSDQTQSGIQDIIVYMGYGLAGLFLIQLIASMAVHKLIGLETIQVLQTVFFVRFLLGNSGSMPLYNMHSISYINGYNPFTKYTNVMNLDGVLMRLGLGKNFVFNVMVQVFLIIVAWIFGIYFGSKAKDLKNKGAERTALGITLLKKAQNLQNKLLGCVFILTTYSFFLFAFGLLSSIQSNNEVDYQLPRLLTIFTMVVFIYTGLYLTAQMYLSWKPKYDEEQGIINKYLTFFVFVQMLLALLVIGVESFSYGLEVMAAIQTIYVVVLVVMRPYFVSVQNVLLIICQFIGLGFTAFLVILKYVQLSDNNVTYAVVGFEGLLSAVGTIGLIRLYLHSKLNQKAFKKMHEEQDKLKGKDTFTKKEFKKQQDMIVANQNKIPTFTQKKILQEKGEKDELAMIKARLRNEYKQKKAEDLDQAILE